MDEHDTKPEEQVAPPAEQEHVEEQAQQHTEHPSEKLVLTARFKRYLQECLRVLKVTKKPTMQEFKTIVKVSGLGMLIIGLLGFIVNLVKEVFLK